MTLTAIIILWLVAATITLPMLGVAAQCLLGLLPGGRRDRSPSCPAQAGPPPAASVHSAAPLVKRASAAVLVPAHNEETGIGATLASLMPQLQPKDRLIVIADNCTDATARAARDAGAQVLERSDPHHRGKGYALAAGVEMLRDDPRAVVIVVDADCTVGEGAIDALGRAASREDRPAQGVFLMYPSAADNAGSVISAFAFMVKNQARPMGLHRLGIPTPLTGSGMAFPYGQIRDAALASGDIVEDLSLGLDLTEAGHGPALCPPARIASRLPDSGRAAAVQRTRWEHGYLHVLLHRTGRLLRTAVRRRRAKLLAVMLDLAIPPLSLLVMLMMGGLAVTLIGGGLTGAWGPTILLTIGGLALSGALAWAWAAYGRSFLPPRAMLRVPLYVLWKLPIYLKFLQRREKSWIRTERE